MFSFDDVIFYHDKAIEKYGGSKGLRDFGGLDAALNRPWQTFDSEELYPTCFEKAAAISESVILNHPFIDGNKRTAFILCEAIIEDAGYIIEANTDTIYNFLVDISTGNLSFEEIVIWLRQNTKPKN